MGSFYCDVVQLRSIKYTKPNFTMVASADVTIYGTKCTQWPYRCKISEHCRYVYETLDDLVMHMVNYHDEMWKNDEQLNDIKIDGDLLVCIKEEGEILDEEGKFLSCECCGKWYDSLDHLLYHIQKYH